MQFARVRQLAQVALTAGGGGTLLLAGVAPNTEITRIVAVFAASGGTLTVYHDDDGTTYDATTAVWVDTPSATYSEWVSPAIGSGIGLSAGGALAGAATAQNCTATVYGIVEDVPQEV